MSVPLAAAVEHPPPEGRTKSEDKEMAVETITVESKGPLSAPATAQLDESVWQAWLAKGRARDARTRAREMKLLKWAMILGLLAVAFSWRLRAEGTPSTHPAAAYEAER